MTAAIPAGGPCLSCRRPLTMRTWLTATTERRELFVCLGHPPRVHRDILAAVIAAESDGHVLSDRFGTFRCPGCGTSSTLDGLHVPNGLACAELIAEREAKAGE